MFTLLYLAITQESLSPIYIDTSKQKEFFSVCLEEIEKACKELNIDVKMTKLVEAREFRVSADYDNQTEAA